MLRRTFVYACGAAIPAMVAPGRAQEGHPLTGTWSGDWGPTATERHPLTLVMNWDGKNITGVMNPGPDSTPLASVALGVTDWTVRIEADAKDVSGAAAHISAQGRLENIASYHRTISGKWSQGGVEGDFRLTRD